MSFQAQHPRQLSNRYNPSKDREQFDPENHDLYFWSYRYQKYHEGPHVIVPEKVPITDELRQSGYEENDNIIEENQMAQFIQQQLQQNASDTGKQKFTQLDCMLTVNLTGQKWFPLLDFPLVSIRLIRTDMRDEHLALLWKAPCFKYGYLQHLDLQHNVFLQGEGDAFKEIPDQCQSLKYLDFQCTFLSSEGLAALVNSQAVVNLVELNLECNLNLTNDIQHFKTTKFKHLKKINLNNCQMNNESLKNLLMEVGHILQDFRYGFNVNTNCPLNFFSQIFEISFNKEFLKQLRILDFSYNQNLHPSFLDQVIDNFNTDIIEQLYLNSTNNFTGINIFNRTDKKWPSLRILDLGRCTEENVVSNMKVSPMVLHDVFFENPHIGISLQSLTFSDKNIGSENQELAYLVWVKKVLNDRLIKVRAITNLLQQQYSELNLSNTSLNEIIINLISPSFFVVQAFDPNKFYDLDFEQYYNPVSYNDDLQSDEMDEDEF